MVHNIQWIKKARKYAIEHPAIIDNKVSEIVKNSFIATFRIYLPGKYDIIGKTEKNVKKEEPVTFVFPIEFPLKAPEIYLRDDFNRNFPHINPSLEKVKPCIFDGELSELLQQPNWFHHILDQMAEWLDNASQDNLINPTQGWEPMRQDELTGFHIDELFKIKGKIKISSQYFSGYVWYKKINNLILSKHIGNKEDFKKDVITIMIYFSTDIQTVQNKYIVKVINYFADLREFATECCISDFSDTVNKEYSVLKKYNKNVLFISLSLRRPCKLINSNSSIESFFFAIDIKEQKHNQKIHQKSKVFMLSGINDCEPHLYRQMSGVKKQVINNIVQIGVGSLGSKINLHLARNGTVGYTLVDNDIFSPHNNARHAIFGGFFNNKANFQQLALTSIGVKSKVIKEDIRNCANKLTNSDLIIDSTASLSVRNFLTKTMINGSIINTSLYNNSKLAIMLTESANRNPRIDDLMCSIYQYCLIDDDLVASFFSEQNIRASIGQGCGSLTTICPDSRISLCASGISSKIQHYISNGIPENGEIFIGKVSEDDMSVNWEQLPCDNVHILSSRNNDEFEVRIFESITKQMKEISEKYSPKEYGGVLIGNISTINRTMTVTDLLDAPEDSLFSETLFEVGKLGLRKKVKDIEVKTNGLLTYIGTWHSHPFGGNPSPKDKKTKMKIIILRDYEPTACLIWTPNGIIRV